MAERRHGTPAPPTESEVVSERWDGEDLSGREFRRVAFLDVDLTDATATGATFEECTFRDTDLNAVAFTDSAFVNCTFVKSSLFGARFTGCKLTGSMFDRCRFGALEVTGGDWSFTGLPGADLRGSDLSAVDPVANPLRNAVVDLDQAVVLVRSLGLEVGVDLEG
ncbi:MAG: pentapeptide repeat-containing protein [Nocardioidaceae bacterium]|nr:pentapeptide repeat-containing protein [Nocardioidaceae bacterium]